MNRIKMPQWLRLGRKLIPFGIMGVTLIIALKNYPIMFANTQSVARKVQVQVRVGAMKIMRMEVQMQMAIRTLDGKSRICL